MERRIVEFLEYLQYEKRYSPHTVVAYRKDLLQFSTYVVDTYGESDCREVSHLMVRSWVFHLSESNCDKRTINRKISALRSFYKYLGANGHTEHHPLQNINSIKVGKSLPAVLPQDVLQRYMTIACNNWVEWRDQILIQVLYETGMRRAELMGMRYEDIQWDRSQLRVLGKGNKMRILPLRSELVEKLQIFRQLTQDEFSNSIVYVIVRDNGEAVYPKWIYNKVKQILNQISTAEKLSPHILRHSIATHLMDNGADVRIIKEFLGHSSMASTEIYTHNSIEKLKAAYRSSLPNLDRIIL